MIDEKALNRANVKFVEAQAIGQLIASGFTHESVVAAVKSGDMSQLKTEASDTTGE